MLSIFDGFRTLNMWSVLLRLGLACFLSALIGLERSVKNRPAGLRTHVLVCIASATAALTSLYLLEVLHLKSDVSRICSQVIAGLGFIGAGTIIVTKKMSIKGLTTAAGLWTTGVIGLAVGNGYYELGIIGTALVLIIEVLISRLGKLIRVDLHYKVEILYNEKTSLDAVLQHCKNQRFSVENLNVHSPENGEAAYCAVITLHGAAHPKTLLDDVHKMPGIVSAVCL